ncbi:hypothetical protein FA13DRAFT_1790016 [Coprinellus micaceus]|uniref:Uncharacterized protein n=1 Tax=Coprinellus micaceus TaxID=71717 RepID=A0A4Y7THZ4_COPMI|nr:hypothetical protein FA13DRAFT_1790016 [Coprinellus micaceus]
MPPASPQPTHLDHNLEQINPDTPQDPGSTNCPIDVLSDDVLTFIFCLFPDRTIAGLHEVLTLSHVCRRWRSLCIECTELWRRYALLPARRRPTFSAEETIDFNQELLERSGDAGLIAGWENVNEIPDKAYPPSLLQYLVNHAHHLESLWVRLDCLGFGRMRAGDYTVVRALERCSAPRLKFRSLSSSPFYRTPTLSQNLFGGDLSSLTALVIERVWFDLSRVKVGANLEKLVVATQSGVTSSEEGATVPESFAEWVEIVARFPCLLSWELADSEGVSSPAPQPRALQATNITLIALTSLLVDSMTMADLEYSANRVSLPSCKRLHIKIRSSKGAEEQRVLTGAFLLAHGNVLLQDYSELTIFNAGVFGFGFGLSRRARTGGVVVNPTKLQWESTDISLFFNQAHLPVRPGPGCHPVEYRAFLHPLRVVAKAVPTLIIFDRVYGTRSGTSHGTMKPADYKSTRELIVDGYEGGLLRNLVGHRSQAEEILDCKAIDEGNGLYLETSVHPDLRLVPVADE